MPVVRVKGVANPMQFPDDMDINDIRSFLQRKFARQSAAGNKPNDLAPLQGQARATQQSLVEKAGQGVSNALYDSGVISDRYGAQRIGENVTALGEFLPGVGDAVAGDDFGRALAGGDGVGMGVAALGAIPLVGDAAKKTIKVYHGGSFKGGDVDLGRTQRANLGAFYSTTDKEAADNFSKSGFFDDDTIDQSRGGEIFEFDVPEDDLIDLDSFSSADVIDSVGRGKIGGVVKRDSPDEYDDFAREAEDDGFEDVDEWILSGNADHSLKNYIEDVDPDSSFEGPSVAGTKAGAFLAANDQFTNDILEKNGKIGFKYEDSDMGGTTVALSNRVNATEILKRSSLTN
jgi:hypothetical protein